MEELYYRQEHKVLMRDCDCFGRMKPSAMLTMFQDGSESLTESWGVGLQSMIDRGAIWVAAKLDYTVTRLPRHEERIVVREWAKPGRAGIFPFECRVEDPSGQSLVSGVSLWVLSDRKTRSMLGPNVPRITLPTPEPAGTKLPRIPSIRAAETCERTRRQVMFSEIDINGHLTNTRYFDWMADLLPAAFHREHPLRGLRVEYRGEISPGEEAILDWVLSEERLFCASPGKFTAELRF